MLEIVSQRTSSDNERSSDLCWESILYGVMFLDNPMGVRLVDSLGGKISIVYRTQTIGGFSAPPSMARNDEELKSTVLRAWYHVSIMYEKQAMEMMHLGTDSSQSSSPEQTGETANTALVLKAKLDELFGRNHKTRLCNFFLELTGISGRETVSNAKATQFMKNAGDSYFEPNRCLYPHLERIRLLGIVVEMMKGGEDVGN